MRRARRAKPVTRIIIPLGYLQPGKGKLDVRREIMKYKANLFRLFMYLFM